MARTIKNRLTTEERRAQAEALQGSIAEQVEQLRTSEQWLAFLRFAQSFHHYSLGNLLLILNQCPTATRVAGFRQWQGKGRQVRKGERAIRIFGYSRKTITPETDRPAPAAEAETTEDSQRTITYYPVLSVFDIGQTNPTDPDATDPDADDPSTPAHRLTGDDQLGILDAVTNYLTQRGWTVEREQISGSANGYTDPTTRRVAIDDHLSPAHAAKTALHEAAHVILHAEQSPNDYVGHRAIAETEAESVAYVVAGLLGVDTSRYSIGYVAGWSAADADTIKTTATHVLHAARLLTDAITDDHTLTDKPEQY